MYCIVLYICRYDEDNIGVIDGSKFMKKLGISLSDHKASSTARMDIPVNTDGRIITPPQPHIGMYGTAYRYSSAHKALPHRCPYTVSNVLMIFATF